jgi:hypothetical protein
LDILINFVQKLYAKDNKSIYSHSGIIIDDLGNTWEASKTVCSKNIFTDYKDKDILVVRYNDLTEVKFDIGYVRVKQYAGDKYPWYRLILYILRLEKYIHWTKMVCSELVAKYLNSIGARHNYWFGTNVDDLHDEYVNYKIYTTIYEGKCE